MPAPRGPPWAVELGHAWRPSSAARQPVATRNALGPASGRRTGYVPSAHDTKRRITGGANSWGSDLATISRRTLSHYAGAAGTFWVGTRHHDVEQNLDALLGAIEGAPPFAVLDFGCGPGRDLLRLRELGHRAVGLDGCAEFVGMARLYASCEVLEQDFLALSLPAAEFDGIFANASLFHVPSCELPRVLGQLRAALKPRGVLFASNPHGADEEGWHGDRYGCYYCLETWRSTVTSAGFAEIGTTIAPQASRSPSSRGWPLCFAKSRANGSGGAYRIFLGRVPFPSVQILAHPP